MFKKQSGGGRAEQGTVNNAPDPESDLPALPSLGVTQTWKGAARLRGKGGGW